jgi:hypothetical protein
VWDTLLLWGVPPLLSLVLADHILSCLLGACSLVSPKPKPNPKPISLTHLCVCHPESNQTASPLRMSVACPAGAHA